MSAHVVLETESQHLICRHCGAMQALATPAPLVAVADAMSSFASAHEHCARPAELPIVRAPRPAPKTTTQALFAWPGLAAWLDEGERGTSSEAIVQAITGIPMMHGPVDVPRDLSDFRRCVLLLRRVPSLRPHLGKVADLSPRWARLVSTWPNLERALADQARHAEANDWIGRNATGSDAS